MTNFEIASLFVCLIINFMTFVVVIGMISSDHTLSLGAIILLSAFTFSVLGMILILGGIATGRIK